MFIVRESSASASGDKETKGANVKANVNCKFSISFYDSSIKVDSFNKLEVVHTRLESVTNVDQLISLVNSQYNSKYEKLKGKKERRRKEIRKKSHLLYFIH